MFFESQFELDKSTEMPSEDAPAELHITKAIERFYYRKNTTNDVKVNVFKLEELYNMYQQQQAELKELKQKMKDARKLLKL
ncbi:hypothetical protein ACXLPV_004833 [Vibrio parahaemolyticus]|nr:hypothetical protein [Vibrio parahaemolyticus]